MYSNLENEIEVNNKKFNFFKILAYITFLALDVGFGIFVACTIIFIIAYIFKIDISNYYNGSIYFLFWALIMFSLLFYLYFYLTKKMKKSFKTNEISLKFLIILLFLNPLAAIYLFIDRLINYLINK